MPIPFIDLAAQHRPLRAQILKRLTRILDTQQFILKENVAELEASVTRYSGARYAVGLASGSDALYLALAAAGIGAGDEVITTPFTFFATAGAVSRTGARPVFADIDAKTFNLDPKAFERAITPRTKAVIPVHLFGLPCDMGAIMTIARRRNILVIEDAAQSFGAEYGGKKTGALGDFGCYSFYPTKNFGGAGDGGMLVTSSAEMAERVRLLRDHGSRKKYIHEFVGINSRLDEMQAAVLNVKMGSIDKWNARRAKHAALYNEAFKDLPVRTPVTPAGRTHIYHLYTLTSPDRDALAGHLSSLKIGSGVYYPLPLHLQPCYKALGYSKGDFPAAEKAANEALSLPMFAELSGPDIRAVIKAVRRFFKKA